MMSRKRQESHIKLLRDNGVPNLDNLTNSNIKPTLMRLRGANKKELSDNYLISILSTIKKYNNNITKKPAQLELKANRNKTLNKVGNKRLIIDVIQYTHRLNDTDIANINHRALIDTYIAIIMVSSTFITVGDLYSLSVLDIDTLNENKVLHKQYKITTNSIYSHSIDTLKKLIRRRDELPKPTNIDYNNNKLVSCTVNIINKTIKGICIERAALQRDYEIDNSFFKSLGLIKFIFKEPDILYRYLLGDT